MTNGPLRRLVVLLAALSMLALSGCLLQAPQPPIDPCNPRVNAVACENSLPGTPQSKWDSGPGDDSIQGFATQMSVNLGQTVQFKINTPSTKYHLDIYRIGYYQGNGARLQATVQPSVTLPQTQPACLNDSTTELVDCGNWAVSASWAVPSTAVSGVYMAHLVRDDNGDDNEIPFVVRDDSSHSDLIYQTSDTTWEAYNTWGGNSLYTGANGKAVKVSYNRPFATRTGDTQEDYFMSAEYPMVRFLEANGYDISYQSGIDTDKSGSLLLNHKTFLSVGHDEYWSGQQRSNVEAARAAGVNLAFFSGNEVYWKTRWESSIDGSNTAYRTLVCYKETASNAKTDPTSTWTGTWLDPRFSPPSDGGRPQNALSGTLFTAQGANDPMSIPAADGKFRFWRNTSMATLAPGTTGTLPTGVVGYEFDTDADNGFRPAGLFDLASGTTQEINVAIGYGATFVAGTATHNMTMYRASSGALVFGAGTIRWSWGLDANHDASGPAVSKDMQQATINVLADMGAQPGTIMSGLTAATMSTDKTPPTTTVTSPASGATVGNGNLLNITGTATDTGGGVVAAVEVSLDGGTTWHRATGTTSWSYSGSLGGTGTQSIMVRASDDSGNVQTTPTSQSVNVVCPCSIFGLGSAPTNPSSGDTSAVEVGTKFTSDSNGWITGVRFYKGSGNTGTHIGNLWTSSGQLLASVTFANETAGGWQTATFSAPVPVTSGTTYVASYYAPSGDYSDDAGYFKTATAAAPVHALADGSSGGNGVYRYGTDGFPTSTSGADNYWVDVILSTTTPADTVPPNVTGQTPLAGSSSVSTSVAPTVTFSEPVQPATVGFTLAAGSTSVPGTVSYNSSSNTATFTPTAALASGTSYTATVSGTKDIAGNTMTGSTTWTFKTAAASSPGVCPCSIFTDSTVPSVVTENDKSSVELGVRFSSDVAGTVTGIRFYKGPQNTGTHTGTLWSASGTKLATATFTNESTTGWQQVSFSSPVAITAGTTYVASYHTTAGYYSITPNQFATGVDNSPLHAPASVSGAANGLYLYGSGGFPTSSYQATNYFVDVVFSPAADNTPPTVTSKSPASGATGVALTATVSATMSERLQSGSANLTLTGPSGAVAGTVAYSDPTTTVSFTPSATLAANTSYTATLSGGKDLSGNVMSTVTWSFTTGAAPPPPPPTTGLFAATATPVNSTNSDTGNVELGVRFSTDTNGWVTGVRFYKGSGNTGTHTGSLWGSDGTMLATATFTNETASGWQTVTFGAPVAITAGTQYIASYHAPNGHYADDEGFFNNPLDNAPLHAPVSTSTAGNGTYAYGASSFPNQSYHATNYWVDVLFTTQNPAGGTAQASAMAMSAPTPPTPLAVAAVMSEAVDPTAGPDDNS
jgi:hypothetical protein